MQSVYVQGKIDHILRVNRAITALEQARSLVEKHAPEIIGHQIDWQGDYDDLQVTLIDIVREGTKK